MENIMSNELTIIEKITLPRIAEVPGLNFRGFAGEADFPKMLAVLHGSRLVDGLERSETLEDVANNYAHLHHCDPYQDMLFAEVNGDVVGYSRVWWELEGSGQWIGFQIGNVLPQWRRKGIGSTMLHFNEERLRQIATQLKESGQIPAEAPCLLDNFASSSEVDRINLIERRGYRAVRYAFNMVRPDLENIPDLLLPPGVEVRPVGPEHMRTIWEATNEAFRDHWGYIPDPWEEFERIQSDSDFDPSLWRVAWQGDQVAGMVLSVIDKEQNEIYGRKRGYTENICVLRPWRRQGLAKALIALSLKAIKERGMTEAGLGVDAENTSGALHLYESMGYRVVKRNTIYRKPLEGG
jgi:ribosomal protein S18 acetylase RimI-like enzyme